MLGRYRKNSKMSTEIQRKNAFSLAEVLITLVIIGVVAAMLIKVIDNANSKEVYNKLLKVQSTLQSAINSTMQDHGCLGDLTCTGLFATGNNATDAIYAMNGITEAELNSGVNPKGITQFLKISKNCGKNTGCFPDQTYLTLGGKTEVSHLKFNTDTSFYSKIILSDGTLIALSIWGGNNCTRDIGNGPMNDVCGSFLVDINSFKQPNIVGRDLHVFWISKNGIIYPGGNKYQTSFSYPSYCNINDSTTSDNGTACAAHVLEVGKIDY